MGAFTDFGTLYRFVFTFPTRDKEENTGNTLSEMRKKIFYLTQEYTFKRTQWDVFNRLHSVMSSGALTI